MVIIKDIILAKNPEQNSEYLMNINHNNFQGEIERNKISLKHRTSLPIKSLYNIQKTCEEALTKVNSKRRLASLKEHFVPSINLGFSKDYFCHSESSDSSSYNKDDIIVNSGTNSKDNNETEIIIQDREVSYKEEEKIYDIFRNHFLFKEFTPELMQLLFQELLLYKFLKNNTIYEEESVGNYCFILLEGTLDCLVKGVKTRTITKFEIFGELSLISQCKREETIKCVTDVLVYALEGEAFRTIQKRLNEARLKERFSFLNTLPFFKPLDINAKYNISEKIKTVQFNPDDTIIRKGTDGESVFIIKDGLVSCQINGVEIRKLRNNEYFGQNCLLNNQKRTIDVIAIKHCICFELKVKDLKDALGEGFRDCLMYSLFKESVTSNKYLKEVFSECLIEDMFKCFKYKQYKDNDNIDFFNHKRIIIILEGNVVNAFTNAVVASRGEVLGEEYLKHNQSKSQKNLTENDLIAHPDLISLEANIDEVVQILKLSSKINNGNSLNTINTNNNQNGDTIKLLKRVNKLKAVYLFKNLSFNLLNSLAKSLTKQKYLNGDIIIEENTFGDTFFLIAKGIVRVSKNNKILRDLEQGNCFGEVALINSKEKRTATVTAVNDVVCYVLNKTEFEKIIADKNIKMYLINKLSLQNTSISLNDLFFIKFLGKGKFGNVNLVHNKQTFYSVKAISRKKAYAQPILSQYILSEKKIMLLLDHPFIVKLVKTMKNQIFCFFLLEYINGINMNEYLKNRKKIKNIEETRFYIGSLLIVLDYLQKKLIAHRDIKPSNIMIDSKGYIKLIDFGTAKILNDYTNTVIGTPHYIAPEILHGKGYSLSVDFWSVGICMYEIFYGVYPFGNSAHEVIEVYKEILHK